MGRGLEEGEGTQKSTRSRKVLASGKKDGKGGKRIQKRRKGTKIRGKDPKEGKDKICKKVSRTGGKYQK